MKCERVRESIADFVDGACGPILRRRVERKIASCPCCAQTLAEERRLRVMLGTWPDEEPAAEVWDRIRSMAAPALTASVEPLAPTWRSVGLALGRQSLPYLLGAATAVMLMVGVGFERPDRRTEEVRPDPVAGLPEPVVLEDDAPRDDELIVNDPRSGVVRRRTGVAGGRWTTQGAVIELLPPESVAQAQRGVQRVSLRRRPARTH